MSEEETPKSSSMKSLIIVAAIQAVLTVAAAAGTWFLFVSTYPEPNCGVEEPVDVAEEEPAGDPIYVSMDPAFVVNLEDPGKSRFLQIQVELMSYDNKVTELVEKHETRIRNDLIILFSSLTTADIRDTAGKTALQTKAQDTINAILNEVSETPDPIEAVYFTKLVIQ